MNQEILNILCEYTDKYSAQKILNYKEELEIIDAKKEHQNKFWKKHYYFRGMRKKGIRNFDVVVKEWYEKCNKIGIIKVYEDFLDYFYDKSIYHYFFHTIYSIFWNSDRTNFYVDLVEIFRNYLLICNLKNKNKIINLIKEILDETKINHFHNSLQILYNAYKND